jgi:hypothetical protein
LAILGDIQLSKVGQGKGGGLFGDEGEANLLNSWRGEALDVLLDAWCMVLEDPLLLIEDPSQDKGLISMQSKAGLRKMATAAFTQLFECIMKTTIYESIEEYEEENDEEEYTNISDDLLRSICRSFIVRLFCYIYIFFYMYVDFLTSAFGWSAFLCRIRFCDTLSL